MGRTNESKVQVYTRARKSFFVSNPKNYEWHARLFTLHQCKQDFVHLSSFYEAPAIQHAQVREL